MFSQILKDTYAIARSRADELGAAVRQRVKVVNEVLGLEHHSYTAAELGEALEREALEAQKLPALIDLYTNWLEQVTESNKGRIVFVLSDNVGPSIGSPESASPPVESAVAPAADKETDTKVNNELLSVSDPVAAPSDTSDAFKSPISEGTDDTEKGSESQQQLTAGASWTRGSELTFKQVLCRSKALEMSLGNLARMGHARTSLTGPIDERDFQSPRVVIQKLFGLCLRGDTKLHTELLFLFCTADDSLDDNHIVFLQNMVSILKVNWIDDYLYEQRRRLATEIEKVKFEINHTANPVPFPSRGATSGDDGEFDLKSADPMAVSVATDKHGMRVRASLRLIELYDDTKINLERSSQLRDRHRKLTMRKVNAMFGAIGDAEKDCESTLTDVVGKRTSLQDEMVKARESLVLRMKALEQSRSVTDGEIAKLEEKRQTLLLELNGVSNEISTLQEAQRLSQVDTDSLRDDLDNVRTRYKKKIVSEGELKQYSETRKQDLQNIRTITIQTEQQLDPFLQALQEDVAVKCKKIEKPSQDLVIKHLAYEKARLLHHQQSFLFFCGKVEELLEEIKKLTERAAAESLAARGTLDSESEIFEKTGGVPTERDALASGLTSRRIYLEGRHRDFCHKLARCVALLNESWEGIRSFKNQVEEESETTAAGVDVQSEESIAHQAAVRAAFDELLTVYKDIKSKVVAPRLGLLGSAPQSPRKSITTRKSSSASADGITSAIVTNPAVAGGTVASLPQEPSGVDRVATIQPASTAPPAPSTAAAAVGAVVTTAAAVAASTAVGSGVDKAKRQSATAVQPTSTERSGSIAQGSKKSHDE